MAEVRASLLGYAAGGSIPGNTKNLAKPHVAARLHAWRAPGEEMVTPKNKKPSARARARTRTRTAARARVPHIKTFARYAQTRTGAGAATLAWVFLGSHNLSGAAWGKFEKNETQLNVLSYELGVLLAPALVGPTTKKTTLLRRRRQPLGALEFGGLVFVRAVSLPGGRASEARGRGARTGRGRRRASRTRGCAVQARGFRARVVANEKKKRSRRDGECRERRDDAADVVVAPLPYPVPPRRYGPADAPWTVDTVHAEPDCFGRTWPPPAL